ncbi:MAG TPA: hypothetical protein VN721_03410 [Flavipsychrobacter sp.]|nr:hypothetical protein [Flavipsychrobacter sp.]
MNNLLNNRIVSFFLTIACILFSSAVYGQRFANLDSLKLDSIRISHHKFINNVFQEAINSIKRSSDTSNDIYQNGKSEDPYLPYQGKIIRHINVESLDFARSFSDTSKRINTFIANVANATHTTTRNFVIRNNLFIYENTPLNAYRVADNERYLRTLDYIHDARIIVKEIPDNPDSIDILVITKDFYTISADGASNGFNHIQGRLVDANLAGMGQRVEVTGLYDYNRHPEWGFGALYRKNNIGRSFISATVGYSTMLINPYTREENSTEYVSFDRPLVSPYSHFAGGLTLSHNAGYNSYNIIPVQNVFIYKYNLYDGWIGYNLGINKLSANNGTIRDRKFLSFRYYNYHFTDVPAQVENNFDPIYNDKQAVLAQFTLFRQDYYKTQYIYGFGTTEDLPYGYNIALTTGWYKQLNLERPYIGVHTQNYIATNQGDFIQLFSRIGGYDYKGELQDLNFMFGTEIFSRLFFWNATKIRQYIFASYSGIYNSITSQPLRIDNQYGIREFLSDSVYGNRRLNLQLETEFYLKYKILGFQFAPFPYVDLALIKPSNAGPFEYQLYSGIGGGIRARNENLVFETIELRFFFYPVAPNDMRGFKVILNANIRYRYTSNYVTAPDVVQLNVSQ